MQILEMVDTGTGLIRGFLSRLDGVIYNALSMVTNLIFQITKFTISSEFVQEFISRFYVIISIYMLFRLAFSLLNGIVNPDSLTDKQTGMQKIIPRILISLTLLILVPTAIFPALMEWQDPIARVIPKIVLGRTTNINYSLNSSGSIGEEIAGTSLQAFVYFSPSCEATGAPVETPPNNLTILDEEIIDAKCANEKHFYAYEYKYGLSSVVGVIMLVIMLSYALDIAIRSIKLCILQVVAPIPIISYINPKSEKDGAFNGWLRNAISTYIDLFIKIALVYFVLFFIKEIFNGGSMISFGIEGLEDGPMKSMVTVFLILGLLFFLTQAPKFIREILGIKNVNNSVGLAGLLGGTAAFAGGLMGGMGFVGSLAAAGTASLSSMHEASEANAQGKQAPGAWGRGSDIAAQIRTGDKNAKGGLMGRLTTAAQGQAMKRTAARSNLTEANVNAAKSNMLAEQQKANELKAAMDMAQADFMRTPKASVPYAEDPGTWSGPAVPKQSDYSSYDEYSKARASFNKDYGTKYRDWETQRIAFQAYAGTEEYAARKKYMDAQVAYAQQEQIAAAAQRNFEKGKKNYEARTLPKPDFTPKQKFDPNKKS